MRNNRQVRKNRRTRRSGMNRYVLICAFIALFAIILAATGMFVHAEEKNNIVYSSIQIQEDDTLWGIAETYYDAEEESIVDYIDNIKAINNIASDNITSGNYIIIYEYK